MVAPGIEKLVITAAHSGAVKRILAQWRQGSDEQTLQQAESWRRL